MLSRLKGLQLLTGWRGSAPKDIAALKEILLRISVLLEDFIELAGMELNLIVFDQCRGCTVGDAHILMKQHR